MLRLLVPIAALLASVSFMLAGTGLLNTLLAVRGTQEGFGEQALGLITSGYFTGFFIGTFLAPPLIRRVGHIRAFAFYASLAAISVLVYPLFLHPVAWGLVRVLTGVALVGLVTVVESWLNAQAAPGQRSQVFAAYMVVSLLGLAAGPLLLEWQPPGSFVGFSLIAILLSLAALPVTLTRLPQPAMPAQPRPALRRIVAAAPTAAVGALIAGWVMGAFWGLGPAYAAGVGLDRSAVGVFMSLVILGGAALQWPVGRLSDRGDRRSTLAAVCVLGGAVSAIAAWLPVAAGTLSSLFFVFGGAAFALYPLCVAHLLDHLAPDDVLPGCSALLLLNGVGAALGPALAGTLMGRFGPQALPLYFAASLAALALLATGRRLLRARALLNPAHFHPMLRTTPAALELLPEVPETPAHPISPERRRTP